MGRRPYRVTVLRSVRRTMYTCCIPMSHVSMKRLIPTHGYWWVMYVSAGTACICSATVPTISKRKMPFRHLAMCVWSRVILCFFMAITLIMMVTPILPVSVTMCVLSTTTQRLPPIVSILTVTRIWDILSKMEHCSMARVHSHRVTVNTMWIQRMPFFSIR